MCRPDMGVFLGPVFGLSLWIVLWAIGAKAFDAAMLSVSILLVAVTIEIVKKYLPSKRS